MNKKKGFTQSRSAGNSINEVDISTDFIEQLAIAAANAIEEHMTEIKHRRHIYYDILTKRERDVLNYVGTGKTNHEIAGILCISVKTVQTHINHIFGKLGLSNRTEAALFAKAVGLPSRK